jgi:flagellar basal-body rod modification protein FlgD
MFVGDIGTEFPKISAVEKSSDDSKLDREDFLSLLITQLKHQDPLNPMESAEFTNQITQFSSLDELFDVNDNLISIRESLAGARKDKILDYIGKEIRTRDNTIYLKDGKSGSNCYTLPSGAEVSASIYNEEGVLIRSYSVGWRDAGEHALGWDGNDDEGDPAGDGVYTFEIEAKDESGNPVPYGAYFTGEVTGVTYEYAAPFVMVGDALVTPENIVEVKKTTVK